MSKYKIKLTSLEKKLIKNGLKSILVQIIDTNEDPCFEIPYNQIDRKIKFDDFKIVIKDVRLMKLQDFTEKECIDFGVSFRKIPHTPPTYIYRNYTVDCNNKAIGCYSLPNAIESFKSFWKDDWDENTYIFYYKIEVI